MLKRFFFLIAVLCACVFAGCTATNYALILGSDLAHHKEATITSVLLRDGKRIEFASKGARYVESPRTDSLQRAVVGVPRSSEQDVSIPADQILEAALVEGTIAGDRTAMLLAWLTGIVGTFVLLVITFSGVRI